MKQKKLNRNNSCVIISNNSYTKFLWISQKYKIKGLNDEENSCQVLFGLIAIMLAWNIMFNETNKAEQKKDAGVNDCIAKHNPVHRYKHDLLYNKIMVSVK